MVALMVPDQGVFRKGCGRKGVFRKGGEGVWSDAEDARAEQAADTATAEVAALRASVETRRGRRTTAFFQMAPVDGHESGSGERGQ